MGLLTLYLNSSLDNTTKDTLFLKKRMLEKCSWTDEEASNLAVDHSKHQLSMLFSFHMFRSDSVFKIS